MTCCDFMDSSYKQREVTFDFQTK